MKSLKTAKNGIKYLYHAVTEKFVYGVFYPLLVAVWVFLCYAINLQALGLGVLIIAACFFFFTNEDLTPVIPIFALFIFLIRDFSALASLPYTVFYALLAISVIFHLFKYPFKKFRTGKLFFPLCLVSFALMLGGVLSPAVIAFAVGLPTVIGAGGLLLFIYLLFLNGIKPQKGFNLAVYLCCVIVIAAVTVSFQLLFNGAKWGNTNAAATVILIAVPACCYLMTKTRYLSSLCAVIVFFAASLYLTGSDGCMGILAVASPFIFAFTVSKLKSAEKKHALIFAEIALLVLCAACFVYLLINGTDKVIEEFLRRADSRVRIKLYLAAIDCFIKYPLTGVGLGYNDPTIFITENALQPFNFHSVFLHVLGTMGIIGIIAYAVYYTARFKIIISNPSHFNFYVFISFVLFEAYAMIDTCEFNVIPLMSYMTLFLVCAEILNGERFSDDSREFARIIRSKKLSHTF